MDLLGGSLAGTSTPGGITPSKLRHAYGIDGISFSGIVGDGAGQTIAIIVAYHDPNIVSDLHQFDQTFGLADPILSVVNQDGGTSLPDVDPVGPAGHNWEVEEALDVEAVHAVAPAAKILVVECDDSFFDSLIQHGVNWARSQPDVSVISMSFGSLDNEFGAETSLDPYLTTPQGHPGITFVSGTGDTGANSKPGGWPAYSPTVVAAGGTTLVTDSSNNYQVESGWSGSGGGVSQYEAQPPYQQGFVTQSTTQRTNPDVAWIAGSGIAVYDSYNNGNDAPWSVIGGTSLATPLWGALFAIADQGRALAGAGPLDSSDLGPGGTLPLLYSLPDSSFHDITLGNNGYPAGPGYDLVTGRGTPIANLLVPKLRSGFYVTSTTPVGTQTTPVTSVTFDFNVPADPSSFSLPNSVDRFTGPGGIDLRSSLNGFSFSNGNKRLTITFAAQSTKGSYEMVIGPNILAAGSGAAMDQNGNGIAGEAGDTAFASFDLDPSPIPTAPVLSAASDSGIPNHDRITNFNNATAATALQFTVGSTVAGATVTLYADGTAIGSATASGSTTTVNSNGTLMLTDGTHSFTVRQLVSGYPQTIDSPATVVTIDTLAPSAPAAPNLRSSSDSGASDSDNITNNGNPTFDVTATEAGSVRLTYGGVSTPYQNVPSAGNYGITLAPSTGDFLPLTSYGTNQYPYFVTTGDFNGDGKPDVVATNVVVFALTILLNDGNGAFTSAGSFSTAGNPTGISSADFNHDGKIDLACCDNGNVVEVFLGHGDGTFAAGSQLSSGAPSAGFLRTPDINGDGNADILLSTLGGRGVQVFLGNGDGTFGSAITTSTGGARAFDVAVADLNGDGKLDAVTTTDSDALILLGHGDGTFDIAGSVTDGIEVLGLALGDFNNDGKTDITISDRSNNTYAVFAGNGNGTFQAPVVSPSSSPPYQFMAAGDFNHDGKLDLAATGGFSGSNVIGIEYGNGDGTFQPTVVIGVGDTPEGVAVADFNNDGYDDIVNTNEFSYTVSVLMSKPTPLADGSYNVYATATDVAGNVSLPGPALSFVIDSAPPAAQAGHFADEVSAQAVAIQFNEDADPETIAASDLEVQPSSGPAFSADSVDYESATHTATFEFSHHLADGDYHASIAGASMTDVAANALTQPFAFDFFILAGDGNRNRTVEITDFNVLAANFGKTGQTFSQGNYDYSADGKIDILDFNILAANFGKHLDPPAGTTQPATQVQSASLGEIGSTATTSRWLNPQFGDTNLLSDVGLM